ncbi:MAG: serine hydrolase [Bacteroidota bacterium]|nr:serine hydrolase [Bacteroidota bacterium]
MKILYVRSKCLILLLLCIAYVKVNAQKKENKAVVKDYFPSAKWWEHRSPSQMKVDSGYLTAAIRFAKENDNESQMPHDQYLAQSIGFGKEPYSDPEGPLADRGEATGIVVYKGYIIAEWGEPERVDMTNSVTKSMLSSVVGVAVDKGLIASVNDTVEKYLPPIEVYDPATYVHSADGFGKQAFLTPFTSAHNRKITWDHLLRQTSDWEGTLWGKPDWADRPSDNPHEWLTRKRNEPGTTWKYNDTRVNALALAATLVWRKPLPEVLREYIMKPIGASNTWAWTGYRNAWIVVDGKPMQAVSGGGHYGGGLFINAYDMARFGLLTLHKGNWNGNQLISESWIQRSLTPTPANNGYGFMNFFLNTGKKLFPSAPESAYAHLGNGTNMIYVDNEHEIVAVVRWIGNKAMDGFIKRLLEALPR